MTAPTINTIDSNVFFEPSKWPHGCFSFDRLSTQHYLPAIEEAIRQTFIEIEKISTNDASPTFLNTIEALEFSGQMIAKVSAILFNLNSAETNSELQEIAQVSSQKLTEFEMKVKQNEKLFERIEKVYKEKNNLALTSEKETLLEKTYKSFVRSGASLKGDQRIRFKEIVGRLANLTLTFGEHLLKDTNDYSLIVEDEKMLGGLPQDVIYRAKEAAISSGKENGWLFTLQAPSFIPCMQYADDRLLREKLWKAYNSRSVLTDQTDNIALIKEICKLRLEMAELLGYKNYAEYVLEERMAKTPQEVFVFLEELLTLALPKARLEVQEVVDYMSTNHIHHDLQKWDWAYYSEKLKKEKFDFDDEVLKPYFELNAVIQGVFKISEKLYGLQFVPLQVPTYHKDVLAFEVIEKDIVIAVLYTDFFPRSGKRQGAWMTSFRERKVQNGNIEIPHISIVCNFTPSSPGHPSLLKFDEVLTLFHEFGHALHGILAKTNYSSLAGTHVLWDFVELPSQIFENWCYEKESLDIFACHYQTKEKIPVELIEKIIESSNFNEGYATIRQVSFGLLDMAYHSLTKETVSAIEDVFSFENEALRSTNILPIVENISISAQFAHIFSGGYAAGYYSYKWAEVLDADAFSLFKESGIFNSEISNSFKEHVLSKGGTEPPMDLYVKFRGNKPKKEALLRRSGLVV